MPDETPRRARLPRAMRLQENREFIQIKNQGQRLVRGSLIANWMPLPLDACSRVGVVTSRKLGKANVRARARRLLRETFRLHQHDFRQPVDMILVARASIVGKGLSDVERDFLSVLRLAKLAKSIEGT